MSAQLTVQSFKRSGNIYADVSVDPQASRGHMASAEEDGACIWREQRKEGARDGGPCVA